jgi:hypothetical protein
MRGAAAVMLASTALILVACAAPTNGGTPTPSLTPVPPEAAAIVDLALADAASHLGVSRDELRMDRIEAQQWPDSSLGCPQPGQQYLQVITPGYLVVISSGSRQLEYHTDAKSHVTLCRES